MAFRILRRSFLQGLGVTMGGAALPRFALGGDWPPRNPSQPVPAGPLTSASITVSSQIAGEVLPHFAGLSYEKGSMASEPLFTPENSDLIGMFRRLGTSLLRIGGNSVDRTLWTPNGAGQTTGQVAPADVDNLAGFLRRTEWRVLYGVNLATSTPQLAAEEIAYASQALGNSLYAVEIGNEPDLYGPTYFPNQTWDLQTFLQRWESFRLAIVQVAPRVVITGPASATHITTWTVPFGETVGNEIALLTQHYYRANGQSPSSTIQELLSPDPTLVDDLAELKQGAEEIGLPFRLSETNSFYNGGATGVSDSYASALWVLDHLFTIALGGGVGVNMHGGGDSGGYTPIADNKGIVVAARPEYYGLLLFTMTGPGPLLSANVSAGDLNVSAYAVSGPWGDLNVVVVNKDATQNLYLTIDLEHPIDKAALELMTCSSLSATSGVTIQGAEVNVDGSFAPGAPYNLPVSGSRVSAYVNAQSAALIRICRRRF